MLIDTPACGACLGEHEDARDVPDTPPAFKRDLRRQTDLAIQRGLQPTDVGDDRLDLNDQ